LLKPTDHLAAFRGNSCQSLIPKKLPVNAVEKNPCYGCRSGAEGGLNFPSPPEYGHFSVLKYSNMIGLYYRHRRHQPFGLNLPATTSQVLERG